MEDVTQWLLLWLWYNKHCNIPISRDNREKGEEEKLNSFASIDSDPELLFFHALCLVYVIVYAQHNIKAYYTSHMGVHGYATS